MNDRDNLAIGDIYIKTERERERARFVMFNI